jgi:hypothetical protein
MHAATFSIISHGQFALLQTQLGDMDRAPTLQVRASW